MVTTEAVKTNQRVIHTFDFVSNYKVTLMNFIDLLDNTIFLTYNRLVKTEDARKSSVLFYPALILFYSILLYYTWLLFKWSVVLCCGASLCCENKIGRDRFSPGKCSPYMKLRMFVDGDVTRLVYLVTECGP